MITFHKKIGRSAPDLDFTYDRSNILQNFGGSAPDLDLNQERGLTQSGASGPAGEHTYLQETV